jgi:hypothetical protein
MGTGGSPHGQKLGIFKCTFNSGGSVSFTGEHGSISLSLSAEDAAYFVVGQSYEFAATKP